MHVNVELFEILEFYRHLKTVTSMGCETHFQNRFNEGVRIPTQKQQRTSIMIGSVMGMTDATLFFSYALNFWFGAWLIDQELLSCKYDLLGRSRQNKIILSGRFRCNFQKHNCRYFWSNRSWPKCVSHAKLR